MDGAGKKQIDHGDVKCGKPEMGLYVAQVCVNASTRDFHTEFDQGPTMICVPAQQDHKSNKLNFCFCVNDKMIIQRKMIPSLSFFFLAAGSLARVIFYLVTTLVFWDDSLPFFSSSIYY